MITLDVIIDRWRDGDALDVEITDYQYQLAKDISVPPRRINEIVLGKRAVTADTALRLARYLGTSERFWLNLQARYDLEVEKDRLGRRLTREVRVLAAK
jgi:addiction module HigA family antidote